MMLNGQERAQLEARAAALAEESRGLQAEVTRMAQERRLASAVSASHAYKAANARVHTYILCVYVYWDFSDRSRRHS